MMAIFQVTITSCRKDVKSSNFDYGSNIIMSHKQL